MVSQQRHDLLAVQSLLVVVEIAPGVRPVLAAIQSDTSRVTWLAALRLARAPSNPALP